MNEQQECCDTPRGFVGGTCDYCGGTVQPEAPEIKLTGTPETDDATLIALDIEGGGKFEAVHVQVSKRLERQRDELLEALARTLNATVLNHRNDRWHLDAEYVIKKIKPAL